MLIDRMRCGDKRRTLRNHSVALGVPFETTQRMLRSASGNGAHPIHEELSVVLGLRDYLNSALEAAVAHYEPPGDGTLWGCELRLEGGYGPFDDHFYDLPEESERSDSYRWETVVTWRWRYTEKTPAPTDGECHWCSSSQSIEPWAASELRFAVGGPPAAIADLWQEGIQVESQWDYEIIDADPMAMHGIAFRASF